LALKEKCQTESPFLKKTFNVYLIRLLAFLYIHFIAVAEIYKNEGNDEYRKKDFNKAIYFYTEGIKVKCKDDELKAKLYCNRAIAYFYMGNYYDSLRDAKLAIQLQPSYLKAIVRGVEACIQLNQFAEAFLLCDKGLTINKNDQKLLELRKRAVKEKTKLLETKEAKENSDTQTAKSMTGGITGSPIQSLESSSRDKNGMNCQTSHIQITQEMKEKVDKGNASANLGRVLYSVGNYGNAIDWLNIHLKLAKEKGDKAEEGDAYGNLGIVFHRLGDFNKAIHYHKLHLNIAKELANKAGEGTAYCNLGSAFNNLGDLKKAMDFHNLHLKIAKEVGDKVGEGNAYGNLGIVFAGIGDFKTAIEYQSLRLKIAKKWETRLAKVVLMEALATHSAEWVIFK